MVFATNLYKQSAGGNNEYATYNFNKSINQYFISGLVQMVGMTCTLTSLYNNGTSIGGGINIYELGDYYTECSANSFSIICRNGGNKYTSILNAVIIYPAIYGDVTIS